jgi:hypothetical protein
MAAWLAPHRVQEGVGQRGIEDGLGPRLGDVAAKPARGIQDGPADGLAISLLTFFNTHNADLTMNSVHLLNIVIRLVEVQSCMGA